MLRKILSALKLREKSLNITQMSQKYSEELVRIRADLLFRSKVNSFKLNRAT
jgi:hypothetical protein